MDRLRKRVRAAFRAYRRAFARSARANAKFSRAVRLAERVQDGFDVLVGTRGEVAAAWKKSEAATDNFLAARKRYWRARDILTQRSCGSCPAFVGTDVPDSHTTLDGYSTSVCQGLIARRACRYKR